MRIHRIYCKSVSEEDSNFELDQSQSSHLSKVLRLQVNDEVEVFDGNGASALCLITSIERKMTSLKRISEVIFSDVPKEKITMIIPVIKKENLHFMVQKLTEIGISELIFYKPDLIDQSIAKKDHRKIIEKCLEVVISSCKQCGSNFIPQLNLFENIIDAFDSIEAKTDSFLFDLGAKNLFNIKELSSESNVCLITGPESGFSDSELELLNKRNIKIRLIGKNTLRAETAPLVIASLVQNQFGNI